VKPPSRSAPRDLLRRPLIAHVPFILGRGPTVVAKKKLSTVKPVLNVGAQRNAPSYRAERPHSLAFSAIRRVPQETREVTHSSQIYTLSASSTAALSDIFEKPLRSALYILSDIEISYVR